MPRYEYKCPDCCGSMTFNHDRKTDRASEGCLLCGSDARLERVYAFNITKKVDGKASTGSVVKSHIEDAKRELKKDKERLAQKDFEL